MTDATHQQNVMQRWHGQQRRIGITGGIASGKSSIGRFLKEVQGLPILDADIYAKEALNPGQPCSEKVIERYGKSITIQDSSIPQKINRSALAEKIFSSSIERIWLEQLIHPIVRNRFNQELMHLKSKPTVVLIIPLLFEANLHNICSEIWLIDCEPEQQIERLIKRDHLTQKQAIDRISAQWPIEVKRTLADLVIHNNGIKEAWSEQINSLF